MKTTILSTILFGYFFVGFMARAETDMANVYFERGKRFYKSERYEEALNNFNEAIKLANPSAEFLPMAHIYRGMIFDNVRKDGYKAVMDYQAYLRIRPNVKRSEVLLLLAPAAFNQVIIYRRLLNSEVNIGIDHYTYLLTLASEPQSNFVTKDNLPYLHYLRGVCLLLAGYFQEAIAEFREVPNGTPVSSIAKIRLATCLHLSGETNDANNIFNAINLNEPLLLTEFYRAYADCGKTIEQEAVSDCEKALSSLSEKAAKKRGGVNLGLIYLSHGDMDKALSQAASLESTSDFSPSFEVIEKGVTKIFSVKYYDPSILYLKMRIFSELARSAYSEIKKEPLNIGRCLLYSGKIDEAKAIFRNLNDPIAVIHLGIAQKLLGDENGTSATFNRLPQSQRDMDLLAFHLAEFGFLKEGLFSKLHPLQFPTLSPQQSGYIFLQKGIYETSTRRNDWLTTAAEDFEYSIACSGGEIQCDPLLLIGLFEAFYHNRHLSKAGAIAETLSIRYPEVAALKSSLSMIDEIQKVWPLGQMPLPQWVSMK